MSISYLDIINTHNKATNKIIDLLDEFDKLPSEELFKKSKIPKSRYTKEIARLEGGCVIEKVKDTEDYRKVYYQLTEHGLNILNVR